MKIVILSLNSRYVHSALAPWYLKAAAINRCKLSHEIEIVELTVHNSTDEIATKVMEHSPDAVGFSCYIWNIEKMKECFIALSKKDKDLFLIAGGPEVSFNQGELLSETPLDAIISGEGEGPFPKFLDSYAKGEDIGEICGITVSKKLEQDRDKGQGGISPQSGNDFPESPYLDEYFERLDGRIAYIETSRGCPFSCTFCLSAGSELKYFPLERAKEEIFNLAKSGAHTIKFVDRTFNANKKRSDKLVSFIIENAKKGIFKDQCFHLEIGADLFDDESLDLLASAPIGLFQVEAGLQSYNEKTLEACDRKTDIAVLTHNLRKLIKAKNIHVHVDLIAGLPYEGIAEFEDSFNKAFALKSNMLQLGFLKLIYGSKLRAEAKTHSYIYDEKPPYEVISNKYISSNELKSLEDIEYNLEQLYNNGRFVETVNYLLEKTQYTPFKLFNEFGRIIPHSHSVPLDTYIEAAYLVMTKMPGINKKELRDIVSLDYLRSVRNGNLPQFLRRKSPNTNALNGLIKQNKAFYDIDHFFRFFILEKEPEYACLIDYHKYNTIEKKYEYKKISSVSLIEV